MNKYIQIQDYWSNTPPKNAVRASVEIGAGDNGVVSVNGYVGDFGNECKIEAIIATELNASLEAKFENKKIVVTLGTDGAGAADATKNTATLIAQKISELEVFEAEASGDGSGTILVAVAEKSFTGGSYATPIQHPAFLFIGNDVYFSEGADKYKVDAWKKGTLSSY